MINVKLKKVLASSLIAVSLLALSPLEARASWRQDSTGWWYTTANSWTTGWMKIDGKWYYFYSDGCATRCNMKSIA